PLQGGRTEALAVAFPGLTSRAIDTRPFRAEGAVAFPGLTPWAIDNRPFRAEDRRRSLVRQRFSRMSVPAFTLSRRRPGGSGETAACAEGVTGKTAFTPTVRRRGGQSSPSRTRRTGEKRGGTTQSVRPGL